MNVKIEMKRLTKTARLPAYQTEGAAGMDLCADLAQSVTLAPGGRDLIPTGIAISLPGPELCAFVYARSGIAIKSGIALSNGVGVIDSDYTGEIKVGLVNLSDRAFTINPGDRIAQMVIAPVCRAELLEVDELRATARGAGGFGSTGI